MADAGLDADIVLDIRAALTQVGRLEQALDRASHMVVTADARAVTAAIDAAVLNADSAVTIVAEAAEVTGSITAAVEAADTGVTVTGDAAEVTGSIDAAVDAADTHVQVTGDVDPNVRGDVIQLGDALDEAGDSAGHLRQVLGLLSVGAAVAGLRALADAASDLQESTSKASVVFGDQFSAINEFAIDAANNTGLARQEALEATATFGNLFQALGSTREEAARMSPEVVQLAADLASFNNIGVDEALEKLRSGLVGEVEPLRSLGVSFLAADVAAKGLELGLAGANGEMTEGAKVQARLALIMEQTSLAQGDFARTSEGLANQQRILGAELKNAAAQAGTLLLPAFEAIIAEARQAVPGLQQLAENLLPALSDAFVTLSPLIGTSVDLLVLLSPILTAIAEVVAAIPSDLIALAGGLLIANKAFGGIGSLLSGVGPALKAFGPIATGAAQALKGGAPNAGLFAKGITGLATSIATVNPLLLGGTVLAAGLFNKWQEGQRHAREVAASTDKLSQSLSRVGTEYTSARQATIEWLDAIAESTDPRIPGSILDIGQALNILGLDTAEASKLIGGGTEEVDAFVEGLGELDAAQSLAVHGLRALTDQQADATKATLAAKAATGELTSVQERQLQRLNESKAPAEDYAKLLDEVAAAQQAAAIEAERAVAKYGPLADQFVGTADALDRLRDSQPAVADGIQALRLGAEPTTRTMFDLLTQIDAAKLSEDEMADAARLLGIDVQTLGALSEEAAGQLEDFASTAAGALPTISDAFKNVGHNGKLSVREFLDALGESTESIVSFREDLQALAEAGFADIAGIIAKEGPEVGASLAAELVRALETGNVEVLDKIREATQGFNSEWLDTAAFFRDTIGPDFILQSTLLGTGISSAFGSGLDFGERIRISAAIAKTELSKEGQAVAALAATEGADAARAYGEALNLDEKTVAEAIKAGTAIKNNAPTGAAEQAGSATGAAFGSGVSAGIQQYYGDVADKASQLVLQAKVAADRAARSQSPSRLFAELGANIALGVAQGIDDEVAAVNRAAADMVTGAAAAAASVPAATIDLSIANAAAAAGDTTSVVFGPGSVVVQPPPGMTTSEARELGEAIVEGAAAQIEARRLSVLGRVQ